jgi:hypothetical protein
MMRSFIWLAPLLWFLRNWWWYWSIVDSLSHHYLRANLFPIIAFNMKLSSSFRRLISSILSLTFRIETYRSLIYSTIIAYCHGRLIKVYRHYQSSLRIIFEMLFRWNAFRGLNNSSRWYCEAVQLRHYVFVFLWISSIFLFIWLKVTLI